MKTYKYEFKYRTSRGRDSYGYNIVSLYINGKKVAMSVGVGFNQTSTALGMWLTKNFQKELKKLSANYGSNDTNAGVYGVYHDTNGIRTHKATKESKTGVDGMCGTAFKIASTLGINLKRVS